MWSNNLEFIRLYLHYQNNKIGTGFDNSMVSSALRLNKEVKTYK